MTFKEWLAQNEVMARSMYRDYRMDMDYQYARGTTDAGPMDFNAYATELFNRAFKVAHRRCIEGN